MKSGKAIAILLSLSVALIVTFQNCAQNKVNFDVADSTKIGPLDCEFGDSFIHNGQSIEVFLESAVDTNQTCVSQIRTCKDTYLSGEYQYLKCQVGGLKSCKLGKLEILHGQSTVAYQKSSVPFGQDCQIENRTCNNGNLSGSFQYTACSKGTLSSCQLGSTEIINNGQIKAYKYSSVPTGSTCDAEFRVCNNGTLSGSFEFTSCNIGGQKSCLLNELQIPHGGTVQAFSKSAVIAPLTCESEVRTCNNGLLSGSYSYLNCAQNAEANCLLDGKEVVSGTSITAYSNNSVVFGSSCQSIAEQRTCNNGILSGSYQYKSCKVQSAPELQLSAPLVIVKGLDKQIELTWTAVPSAASYVVERSMDNKNYSAINANACDLSNLKCTDTSLVNGTQYYYRIYAKDSNNTNGIPTYVLAKPYAVSDAMYGKAISTLTWSAVDGASYQLKKIHRNSSGVVSESVIYTGSNTSKTDTIDVNNNSYTYILTVNLPNGAKQERTFVLHGRAEGNLYGGGEQEGVKINLGLVGLSYLHTLLNNLSETNYGTFSKIEIRRKVYGDANYQKIKEMTSENGGYAYDDTSSLVFGKTYCYQVQVYYSNGSSAPYNRPDCIAYMGFTGNISGTANTLTWSAVDGASYQLKKIHRNSSGVVSESVIYTGSNTSKTDMIDVNNNSYTYILTVNLPNGSKKEYTYVLHGRAEGSWAFFVRQEGTKIVLGSFYLSSDSEPLNLKESNYGNFSKIEVRRKVYGDANYQKIKEITTDDNLLINHYDDTSSLVFGKTYCYQVQVYYSNGSSAPYNRPDCIAYMGFAGTISGTTNTLTWSAVDGATNYQLKKIHRNSSGIVSESVIYTGTNTSKVDTIDVNNNSYTYILTVNLPNGAKQERTFVVHGRAEGELTGNMSQDGLKIKVGIVSPSSFSSYLNLKESNYGTVSKIELRRKVYGDANYQKIKEITNDNSNHDVSFVMYDDTASLVSGKTYCYQFQIYYSNGSSAPYNRPDCIAYMNNQLNGE